MRSTRAKSFAYEVAVDESGRISAEDEGAFVDVGDEWTADHLLLAAVVRCSIVSLQFHARRVGSLATAAGNARGVVTRPESEDLYRFVSIEVEIDGELDPPLEPDARADLLDRAQRDCFVGSSLITKPTYTWRLG
jgi:hypothetical protein